MYPRPERPAVDAVETGTRHLHQAKLGRMLRHMLREPHRHQHIDIAQARHDAGLVIDDQLAWQ